jgi:transposase
VQRENIISLSAEGLSQAKIAKRVKCSRKGVQYTIKRYNDTGSLENKPLPGPKMKTSPRGDRRIARIALSNRKLTSSQICDIYNCKENVKISPATVRKRLIQAGLKGCKARKKPWLTEKNRAARLRFAQKYKDWKAEDWEHVLWSDETNIEVRIKVKFYY